MIQDFKHHITKVRPRDIFRLGLLPKQLNDNVFNEVTVKSKVCEFSVINGKLSKTDNTLLITIYVRYGPNIR